jgi:hypothetical protein
MMWDFLCPTMTGGGRGKPDGTSLVEIPGNDGFRSTAVLPGTDNALTYLFGHPPLIQIDFILVWGESGDYLSRMVQSFAWNYWKPDGRWA